MGQIDPSHKELQISSGWLEGFKRRFKSKGYAQHGEVASTNNSLEAVQRVEESKLMFKVPHLGHFNMDETRFSYQLEPIHTLDTHPLYGRKKQKERIRIALTNNVDGSIKLPTFVIN